MDLNLGIIISGQGSNMMNIVKSCLKKRLNANVKVVITNNPFSEGIEKLKNIDIPKNILDPKKFKNKDSYEEEINKLLIKNNVNFVCLAGYKKILGLKFLNKWNRKVINIHPSLLPSFKGLNAQEKAFKYGVKYTGCTVHFVNNELDGGEIIDQKVVEIKKEYDLPKLKKKILKEEHKLYINVLRKISMKGIYK